MISLSLDLPILFNSDATEQLDKLDLPFNFTDCERRELFFLTIDVIQPYFDEKDNDRSYSKIFSGGVPFICDMPYLELRALILQTLNK